MVLLYNKGKPKGRKRHEKKQNMSGGVEVKILFQGDSVTDCKRNRQDPLSMGNGYVSIIADKIGTRHILLNKGESGDTTTALRKR